MTDYGQLLGMWTSYLNDPTDWGTFNPLPMCQFNSRPFGSTEAACLHNLEKHQANVYFIEQASTSWADYKTNRETYERHRAQIVLHWHMHFDPANPRTQAPRTDMTVRPQIKRMVDLLTAYGTFMRRMVQLTYTSEPVQEPPVQGPVSPPAWTRRCTGCGGFGVDFLAANSSQCDHCKRFTSQAFDDEPVVMAHGPPSFTFGTTTPAQFTFVVPAPVEKARAPSPPAAVHVSPVQPSGQVNSGAKAAAPVTLKQARPAMAQAHARTAAANAAKRRADEVELARTATEKKARRREEVYAILKRGFKERGSKIPVEADAPLEIMETYVKVFGFE